MGKSLVKRMQDKFKKGSQEPRSMEQIQQAYQELTAKAGQAQYQVYVFQKELENINAQLVSVNQEGAARQKLDKAAAEAKQAEAKNG